MTTYRVTPAAQEAVDEINDYTAERWGEKQAATYIQELFTEIGLIAERRVPWRSLPASVHSDGYFRKWRSHRIYWRTDEVGIVVVAVLHQAMDERARLLAAFSPE